MSKNWDHILCANEVNFCEEQKYSGATGLGSWETAKLGLCSTICPYQTHDLAEKEHIVRNETTINY